MPASVSNVVALRRGLKKLAPEIAVETQKEISGLLRSVTNKARGFVPSEAPLSGWGNKVGIWANRAYDSSEIRRGITYSTAPSRPNRKGFRSMAAIYNKSAAGAIYETAGRKNPMGQPSQASTRGKFSSYVDTSNKVNKSANPNAGKQFINSMGEMYKSTRQEGQRGRISRKMNGRLIFRAWGEDQGKTNALVIKAIEKSLDNVVDLTKKAA